MFILFLSLRCCCLDRYSCPSEYNLKEVSAEAITCAHNTCTNITSAPIIPTSPALMPSHHQHLIRASQRDALLHLCSSVRLSPHAIKMRELESSLRILLTLLHLSSRTAVQILKQPVNTLTSNAFLHAFYSQNGGLGGGLSWQYWMSVHRILKLDPYNESDAPWGDWTEVSFVSYLSLKIMM